MGDSREGRPLNEQRGLFGDIEPVAPKTDVTTPVEKPKHVRPKKVAEPKPSKPDAIPNMATPSLAGLGSLESVANFFSVTLRKHQAETLDLLLQRRSVILNAPTSSGKSLCFQGASLLLAHEGVTVVVYPLRALVRDQVRRCHELGLPFGAYYGETPRKERPAILEAISNRSAPLVLTTPESLTRSKSLQQAIAKAGFALLAVDEAHAFEEWSFAFRPSYRYLGPTATRLGAKRILLCSATFTHFGALEAARVFNKSDWIIVKAPATRPNLRYGDLLVHPAEFLQEEIRRGDKSGIAYFVTKRELETTYSLIGGAESGAFRYHGSMTKKERRETQDAWFQNSKYVLATKALGMGVDKRNVRTVIHAQLPASVLDYAQEAGRAGRDGEPAECLLTLTDDGGGASFLLNMSLPSPDTVERVFKLLVQRSATEAESDGWFYLDPQLCSEHLGVSDQSVYVAARWLADSGLLKLSIPDRDWKFVFPSDVMARAEAAGRQAPEVIERLREFGQTSGEALWLSSDELEEALECLFADWKGKLHRMAEAEIFEMEAPVRDKKRVAVVSTDYTKFDGSRLEDARQRAIGRLSRMRLLQAHPAAMRAAVIEREATTDVDAFRLEIEKLNWDTKKGTA